MAKNPNSENDAVEANTKSSHVLESKLVAEKRLKDIVDMEKIALAINAKAMNLTNRDKQRISNEKQIVGDLDRLLKKFDENLKVMPFGSATYGFSGSDTNFNICLVNRILDGKPTQNYMAGIFERFVAFFKTSIVAEVFGFFDLINCDRVRKSGIHAYHFASKIFCVIQIDTNRHVVKSSQIIRDCLLKEPICFHLIAYVQCWQSALFDVAYQNGTSFFRFSMHLISVLVIFFCQVDRKLLKLASVPKTQTKYFNHLPSVNTNKLKKAVGDFFQFYGNIYEKKHELISVNIGRWEDRYLTHTFGGLTPEQKRLRDGIKSNPLNWKNCAMFVEDIKSPGKNIAAEIGEEEANIFQEMCKMCASSHLYERAIDEYLLKDSSSSLALLFSVSEISYLKELPLPAVLGLTSDEDEASEPPAKKVALTLKKENK